MSNVHITSHRKGFDAGYTKILDLDDIEHNTGMDFGIVALYTGASFERKETGVETQIILLGGDGTISVDTQTYEVSRSSLFLQNPWAFDLPKNIPYKITAAQNSWIEVAIIKAKNDKKFSPIVLSPDEIPGEQRGEGLADGTMHRIVRAIFGDSNAPEKARPKESNLVVGEVVNFPGRWSSYPPHYHPHAEVYYYRFDYREGFGISLVDDPAPIVKNHDVIKILNCVGHSQVAAPGYAMWYLWFIRQIDGNRYEGSPPFTFFPEHEWVNYPDAKILTPKDGKY